METDIALHHCSSAQSSPAQQCIPILLAQPMWRFVCLPEHFWNRARGTIEVRSLSWNQIANLTWPPKWVDGELGPARTFRFDGIDKAHAKPKELVLNFGEKEVEIVLNYFAFLSIV